MNIWLKIILLIGVITALIYIHNEAKKSNMNIKQVIFWYIASFLLFVTVVFDGLMQLIAKALGIYDPVNAIFLVIISILAYKVFRQAVEINKLTIQVKTLAQKVAINVKERR